MCLAMCALSRGKEKETYGERCKLPLLNAPPPLNAESAYFSLIPVVMERSGGAAMEE